MERESSRVDRSKLINKLSFVKNMIGQRYMTFYILVLVFNTTEAVVLQICSTSRGEGTRWGSDFSRRRQILGQDTYLREDCERSERLQSAAGGKFFEEVTFKVKID